MGQNFEFFSYLNKQTNKQNLFDYFKIIFIFFQNFTYHFKRWLTFNIIEETFFNQLLCKVHSIIPCLLIGSTPTFSLNFRKNFILNYLL